MPITGVFFKNQILTSHGLGAFGDSALSDGILNGCEITTGSNSCTISSGHILAAGRVISVSGNVDVSLSHGGNYAALYVDISHSDSNPPTINFGMKYGGSISSVFSDSAYPSRQNDINRGATSYQTPIALFVLSGSSATLLERKIAMAKCMDLIWSNGSPEAAFPPQHINLSTGGVKRLLQYDALLFVCRMTADHDWRSSTLCPFNKFDDNNGYYLTQVIYDETLADDWDGWQACSRWINIKAASGYIDVWGGHCATANSTRWLNNYQVPMYIYGLKAR